MNRALRSPYLGVAVALVGVAMLIVGLRGSAGLVAWGVAWLFAGALHAGANLWQRYKARGTMPSGTPWPPDDLPQPDSAGHAADGFSSDGGADVH